MTTYELLYSLYFDVISNKETQKRVVIKFNEKYTKNTVNTLKYKEL